MSKVFWRMWLALALLWSGHALAQDRFTLGVSNEVVGAAYSLGFRPDASADFSFWHADQDARRSNLLSAGLSVQADRETLRPHIGIKAVLLDGAGVDAYALAVDAGLSVRIVDRLWVDAAGAYAPDIIVGGDFDRYFELSAKVGYEIMPTAQVFVGFATFKGHAQPRDYRIYQGVLAGFTMSF